MADAAAAQQPPRAAPVPGAAPTPNSSLLSRFRSLMLSSLSFLLTLVVLANAYFQRQQFYPSVVYITKSNPSMAVIYVQAFVFVILFGKLVRKIFFGRLRAAEFEHLMERSWYAVTETCLAFTVFKDDFSPKFVALFTVLLFLKSFHWLAEDRVDFMERSPTITALFHVRVVSLNLLLAALDVQFIAHAYTSTLTKGPSVQLVFGFEYAILLTIVANTLVKYVLHGVDLYSENPWENKAVFMLYTELVIGLVKVILYVVFIGIMIRIYTLPLFAVRPMYLTMRAFKKAFNDVILSRRAIYNMNMYYPDATDEELASTDNVCIICRDEMTASPSTKKLPCNHIFHKNCLRSWFQRQQTCPTCRLDVLRSGNQNQARQRQQAAAAAAAGGAAGQQQQPQQPGANLNNNNINNPFLDMNNIFAQMAAQFPQQQQQQRQGQQQQQGQQPQQQQRPPFLPPPFPFFNPAAAFPGAAAVPPPPMPPPNFAGLTEQELRDMEGDERQNVEARIRCLRNIQVLLDAAVMEMQQYSNVVAAVGRQQRPASSAAAASTTNATTSSSSAATTTTTAASSSASAASTATTEVKPSSTQSSLPPPTSETGARPKVKSAAAPARSEEEEIIRKMDEGDKQKEETPASASLKREDSEQDELRRRRLAKFESSTSASAAAEESKKE